MTDAGATQSDSSELRKARGAFFTPATITRFMTDWAVRTGEEKVLEPSAGDAAFLVESVRRLREFGVAEPQVFGVEIHADSLREGARRVVEAGGQPQMTHSDFFAVDPQPAYSVVLGNPPYIRFQSFTGQTRTLSRAAALRGGVRLSGLASSWAAFLVHAAQFLTPGGRMAFVLPAELLSVNYAAAVRRYLLATFERVELVLFEEQVFPDAEADVVLLLADGYQNGPTDHAIIRQTTNGEGLSELASGARWVPTQTDGKWTGALVGSSVSSRLNSLTRGKKFAALEEWGAPRLGMVTGANAYFTLTPDRVQELGLSPRELLRVSPAGSAHLRGLAFTERDLRRLSAEGKATYLFYPSAEPTEAARSYIDVGHKAGVDSAYKCRVRTPWYRVPLLTVPDLFLTYMNADTPRLTSNDARAHHLNSVHGVYLNDECMELGRELLPIASLNSVTLLHAELAGRAYGGGILKIEPGEARSWMVPSRSLVQRAADDLRGIQEEVATLLAAGELLEAVHVVDRVMLLGHCVMNIRALREIRDEHRMMSSRRTTRGASGR